MPRSFALYLEDLLRAADRITEYIAGLDKEAFLANGMAQSAVERQFTIIGEAMAQMRRRYPLLMEMLEDKHRIIGFRNILIHEYFYVDPNAVWSAVISGIAPFRAQVVQLQTLLDAGQLSGLDNAT
jgi:uncharacterized protein with HEPN domain